VSRNLFFRGDIMLALYGSDGSPFVARVRMQLYAKNLTVELRPALIGTPEFQRLNPIGKMPVLDHDGWVLPESQVICEYVEEAFPVPSLLGGAPRDRARIRLVARVVDLYCGSLLPILRAAADPSFKVDVAEKRAELERGLAALETYLGDDGFAVGSELTLADCFLAPWLFYGAMLTQRGDDTLARRAKLARYTAFIATQAVVQRVWGEMDVAFRAFMTRWQQEQAAKAS
jgi:glutathione S-transferase